MRQKQRRASLVLLGTMTVFWTIGLVTPASAEVTAGGCTGTAEFSDGTSVSVDTPLSEVIVVPEADTVNYNGSINLPPPDDEVPFNGSIVVRLPRVLWTVVTWSGETVEVSDAGTYHYEVPSYVPRGIQFEVSGNHTQQGQTCGARVTMKLDGSPGTAALIAATGTLVFGAATIAAGSKKRGA